MDCTAAAHLAFSHHLAGRREEAEALCKQVLSREPNHPGALHVLALMAQGQKRFAVALRLADMSIGAAPGIADYHNTRGTVLGDLQRLDDAATAFHEAIRLRPGYVEAWQNLARVLHIDGRLTETIEARQTVVRLKPGDAKAHEELAHAFHAAGDAAGMMQAMRSAVSAKPNDPSLHSALIYTMHYPQDAEPAALLEAHLEWARRHEAPLHAQWRAHENDRADRRLRVGYISADFRQHTRAAFMEPVLAAHDRTAVEIYCYSDVARPDEITERIRRLADVWRETSGVDDAALAERIRADRIDVLVDLTGHMAGNRLCVFARRPAPVQVSYPGYPNTTGLTAIDYLLTDDDRDPPGAERWHTERLIRLPVSSQCYRPPDDAPDVGPPPCLAAGHVTFGVTNRLEKVTAQMAGAWATILTTVPGARLLVQTTAATGPAERGLSVAARDKLAAAGVPRDRVDVVGRLPRKDYFALYHRIDIALDTFPYNGHTTTLDALWMGVPTITLAGETHLTREGLALLKHVGLDDLIARDVDGYVLAATRLALDRTRLSHLRVSLRQTLADSPLCDAARVAGALEANFRQAWRDWCKAREREG